jgi:hypothetical protein
VQARLALGLVAVVIIWLGVRLLTGTQASQAESRVSLSPTKAAQPTRAQSTPAVKVTTATFEPVYRAAKSIQAATVAGVSYVKFRELMQGLATEIGIAKDHPLNESDVKLIALYEEAFRHYQTSAALWAWKIDWPPEKWDGEIPVWFAQKPDSPLLSIVAQYDLPLAEHSNYKTVPGDSVQRIWRHADAALDKATAIYYGKAPITQ